MPRQVINKNQTKSVEFVDYNGQMVAFNIKTGYLFSDNPAMDDMVNHFLSLDGFELKKSEIPKSVKVEEPKEEKIFFSKKDKKDIKKSD